MAYVKPGQPLEAMVMYRDTTGAPVAADALPTATAFFVDQAGVAEPASIAIAQATDDAAANVVGVYTVTLPAADSAGTGTAAVDGNDIAIHVSAAVGGVTLTTIAKFEVRSAGGIPSVSVTA